MKLKIARKFKIGDSVKVNVGTAVFRGRVAENRGKIGVRGRNLYRIVVKIDGEKVNIELPADQLRVSRRAVTGKKVLPTAKPIKKARKAETV
jgi:hypothetical protein